MPLRVIAPHAAGLLVACLAVLILRGVRFDDSIEHAQVLLGLIVYPEWHPLPNYLARAFTIQTWFTAGTIAATGSIEAAAWGRSLLVCLVMIGGLYACARGIGGTGRTAAAIPAVVFVLAGGMERFCAFYDIWVLPHAYSNGIVGQGFALLVLTCAGAGRYRLAALLLGLMPLIHIGHMPALLLLAGVFVIAGRLTAHPDWSAASLVFAGTFAVSMSAFLAWTWAQHEAIPLPYVPDEPLDPDAVWWGYANHYDGHRVRPLYGPLYQMVLGLALLPACAAVLALIDTRSTVARFLRCIAIYGVLVALVIVPTRLLQEALGDATPRMMLAWMPYRLSTQTAILLGLMASVFLLAPGARNRFPKAGIALVATAILWLAVRGPLQQVLENPWVGRYLAEPSSPSYLLLGGFVTALVASAWPRQRAAAMGLGFLWGVVLACLMAWHQWHAACWLAGAALVAVEWGAGKWRSTEGAAPPQGAGAPAALVVIAVAAFGASLLSSRAHLVRPPFTEEARACLDGRLAAGELVFTPPQALLGYQLALNAPVFCDVTTPSFLSYVPEVGPATYLMYRDVLRYDLIEGTGNHFGFRDFTTDDWARLGELYGIRYALLPSAFDPPLPIVRSGDEAALYAIPSAGSQSP